MTNTTTEYTDYLALLEAVRARLAPDFRVTVEYPGCIVVWAEDLIDHPDHCWWFGTANATWMGDLCNAEGDHLEVLKTDVPSDCTDPTRIADAIKTVLHEPGAYAREPRSRIDIIARALTVIVESDGADEHAHLIHELKAVLAAMRLEAQ
jgi:hypothetical protein